MKIEEPKQKPTKPVRSKKRAAGELDGVDSEDVPVKKAEPKQKPTKPVRSTKQAAAKLDGVDSEEVPETEEPQQKPTKTVSSKKRAAAELDGENSEDVPAKKIKKASNPKRAAKDDANRDDVETVSKVKGRKKITPPAEDEDIDFDLDDYMPGSSIKPVAVDKDKMVAYLQQELGIDSRRVNGAVALFQEGCTLPFIARYRKEQTGEMSEDELRKVEVLMEKYTNLVSRKAAVLGVIEKAGKLTAPLRAKIDAARTLAQV